MGIFELLSWGHGHLYQGPGVQDLKQKLALGVPFDELGKAEHYLLIDQFDRVRGNYINRYIIGIPSFKRVLWSRDELEAVYVIPYFVRDVSSLQHLKVTFKQWIEADPRWGYDEPKILSHAISPFCPTSADGLHPGTST